MQFVTFPILVFVVPSVSPTPAQWCLLFFPVCLLSCVGQRQWSSYGCLVPIAARRSAGSGRTGVCAALLPLLGHSGGVSLPVCWQFALNCRGFVTFTLCQTRLKFSSSEVTGEDGQTTAEQKTVLGLIWANCSDGCDWAGARNSLVLIWSPTLLLHGCRAVVTFLSLLVS